MIKSIEDATFWDLVREAWEMPLRYQRMFWRMLGISVLWMFAILVLAVIMLLLFRSMAFVILPVGSAAVLLSSWIMVKWLRAFTDDNVDPKKPKGGISKSIWRVAFLSVCSYVVAITIGAPLVLFVHSLLGGDSLVNYLIGLEEIPLTIGSFIYDVASAWLSEIAFVLFLTAIVRAALGEPVKLHWPNFSVMLEIASYLFVVVLPFLLVGILADEFDTFTSFIISILAVFLMMPFAASASLLAYQRMGFSLPEKPTTDFQSYF